ncbi:MAG: cardiolipin synthase [Firmicutes bacterium]|nr:cardiolipin synthase [Bacillota bacterium]
MPDFNINTLLLIKLLLLAFVAVLNIAFMIFVIFVQRRNTAATWAWVAAIALVPIGGFVVYMLVGQDSKKQKVFLKKSEDDDKMLLAYQGLGANEGEITDNNQVTLFHNGVTKFESLLKDIAEAKETIFVQYYIMRGDEVGHELINALAARAKDGLVVRLLVDSMGCRTTPREMYQPLLDAGGQLALFLPPVPVRINFRNHRKIAVIDGSVAYLGGSNIGREYLGRAERFGNWRDTHMRIIGGAVAPLTLRFIMDWNFSAEKMRTRSLLLKSTNHRRFILTLRNTTTEMTMNPDYFKPTGKQPGAKITIVSSGPDTPYPYVLHGFCRMIMEAKKSVYIQSPYFVPDDALFTALRIAAISGVDVRIMYPANPDHPFVYWAGSSYVGELMCAGVKGYEYTNGFIHSKTIMIDSKICSVGTANMDVRSFKINFETQAFIQDAAITQELEKAFERDMEDCRLLTLRTYNQRKRRVKIKESISRLFSPLI